MFSEIVQGAQKGPEYDELREFAQEMLAGVPLFPWDDAIDNIV